MTHGSPQPPHIIVVEDDHEALTGCVEVLRRAGYSVSGASSFEEGRRLLDAVTPHLLITDVRLGAYNGLQLVVRARCNGPHTQAIVLTGFPDDVIRDETERLHAIYMEKPLNPAEFLQVVSEVLAPPR